MPTMRAVLPCLLLAACTSSPPDVPEGAVDLRAALGTTDNVAPVGVAVAPTGERFVFDESRGLFRLDGDTATAIVEMARMPLPAEPVELPYTDLVALSPTVFALTAIGDGFVLDTQAMTLTQHFCYVPDSLPAFLIQRTDAIAFDATTNTLWAQPATYDEEGVYQYSQLARYDAETGIDTGWWAVPAETKATGMIVLPDGRVLLGEGAVLSSPNLDTGAYAAVADLAAFGVQRIDGIALDTAANALVVVDGVTDSLVTVPLADLAL